MWRKSDVGCMKKGRVAVNPYEKDGKTYYNPVFISEKVEFLQ